jgi:hypothetical protein
MSGVLKRGFEGTSERQRGLRSRLRRQNARLQRRGERCPATTGRSSWRLHAEDSLVRGARIPIFRARRSSR